MQCVNKVFQPLLTMMKNQLSDKAIIFHCFRETLSSAVNFTFSHVSGKITLSVKIKHLQKALKIAICNLYFGILNTNYANTLNLGL